MTLPREIVTPGMLKEYESFGGLVAGISDEDWHKQTRCSDWEVADVAAHVVGQLTDVVGFHLEGLGSPEVAQRQVQERRDDPSSKLMSELTEDVVTLKGIAEAFNEAAWAAPAPGGVSGTLGFAMEGLWFDTYVHADDIRNALGMPTQLGDGLVAAVSHLAQLLTDQGWGPATLAFPNMRSYKVGDGSERFVTGDPVKFVLVASGRTDPTSIGLDETVNVYRRFSVEGSPDKELPKTRSNWTWRIGGG